ncbi:MAG: glycosyltransferase family 1 protein [Candidatus Jettenia sp.]|uniref:Putative glycosyltransferase n=1 Tax=Candidatus Jettenia caeni TaxID=247490 RepID=I3INU0_9BACT|nr:glycosyltransferase family 1 protein [Candidatus Jettenia sp. AMX1]MBC6927536.1 glycosyltransferase family 1 protein [Candidatus Jettenia sp.]NUN23930.1 glycosyltransferase family 4 protein [Candidatus Jettenia caeni]KAA0251514.1 MAG: glycosyltransferase family 1 protein [Candidatus Jettenia sp. AMX1]MCE7881348.1 glycosyltransferase family 1 protein [Candidatus Jettenia sp. AMX1]MCQ3926066.1 glycosyltransferase family 1 protein [Candidatus Jettenia sp.]
MKIAINTTSAVAGGGITYIKSLLTYLSKIDTHHQYLVLTTSTGKETFYFQHPNFTFISFRIPSKNPLLRIFWEQCILPSFLKREGVDVLFSPGNICPFFTTIRNVVMIQNVEPLSDNLLIERGLIQNIRLRLLKQLTLLSIKKAHRVIFPSKKARTLIERTEVSIKHAGVIYHGINKEIFRPYSEDTILHRFKKKYGLKKFILYVSHIQRYKNFLELTKAFILLRDKISDDTQLIFAGEYFDREYYNEMKAFIAEHRYENRIIFLGNIPYEELPYLCSACILFVYPSTCESFGMTLVEAMACGAPVLASHREPMTEICGNAAIYFDPTDPDEIADVILRTLKNQELISALRKKAIERAKAFSWENTAINTLKIFESSVL